MGQMGSGYGSECHLLRWMGRHRTAFDKAVRAALGNADGNIDWLDLKFQPKNEWADEEWKGLDFITDATVRAAWRDFWPQRGNPPNWDTVGRLTNEWLLVEAKAHLGELRSECKAKPEGGQDKIHRNLEATANACGITEVSPWLKLYYQMANRLTVLRFLHAQNVPARLLLIYFVGDLGSSSRKSPQTVEGWKEALERQDTALGLNADSALRPFVHKLFLHVNRLAAWKSTDENDRISFE